MSTARPAGAPRRAASILAALCAALMASCASEEPFVGPEQGPTIPDAAPDRGPLLADGAAADGGRDAAPPEGCPRLPAAADRVRRVVVSHPFSGAGAKANLFEVLALSAAGELTRTGSTFSLGVATTGEIAFTPDGRIGLVAQEQGTLGVFAFEPDGSVRVVHAAFDAAGYASSVLVGPEGDRAYVLDAQWRSNGGGIRRVSIGCDGTLTDEGLLLAAHLPYALRFVDARRALVVARDIGDVPAGNEVHLVDLGDPPRVLTSSAAFGDEEAIVSSAALSAAGRHLLIADAAFGAGNRLAAVELTAAGALEPRQVLAGFADPAAVLISPFDNAALVLGAEANSITVLDYDPASPTPFAKRTALDSAHKPLLPSVVVALTRGALAGRVLTAENVAVRQLQLAPNGAVSEVSLLDFGSGVEAIVGALGVQP